MLVARVAARQWSVLHVSELRACGLSHKAISLRVRNGHLHPMFRAVYAVGHANPPREGWFLGAVKACGARALLSRISSAVHQRFLEWEDRWPDVLIVGSGVASHPRINAHRTLWLPPEHVTVHRGIPVTTPVRTLLDLAAVLPERRLRRAVRQAQFLGLVTVNALAAALAGPGPRRGRAVLARIIATGAAPTRSELEDAVLDLILRGGLEHPDVNVPLVLGGRRVIPDFRWPRQRLVVEADGGWHDDPLARAADAERQALLEAAGERVIRVTWEQTVSSGRQTLGRLVSAGAPRASTRYP